jgi:hypothetical protein
MITRPQYHTPHIVSPICSLKINTTTIDNQKWKGEIFNTTEFISH